ncbi:MAG: hypothetical protein QM783_08690 [Phycisphaerales bacterium]
MFTGVFCPALSKFYNSNVDVQIGYDATRLVLAARAFGFATGQPPASEKDLAPQYIAALPPSARSGQLVVRSTPDRTGFIVYSLGRDRTDNGGNNDTNEINDFRVKDGYDLVYFRSTPAQPAVNKEP